MKRKIIQIKKLDCTLSGISILKNINIDIFENSYNVILGGNGAGKTTLVRCLLGLNEYSAGDILYKGQKITRKMIQEDFSYVPQFSKIKKTFPITVRELIDLECELSTKDCSLNTSQHLENVGLNDILDNKIYELSGGQLQKLLIARGLVSKPRVLILDEPTNNLDKKSQLEVLDFFNRLASEDGIVVIHITHELDHVTSFDNLYKYKLVDGTII